MATGESLGLVALGLGVGALLASAGGDRPRRAPRAAAGRTLRQRAVEAQEDAARAAELARELTAAWQAELDRGS